MPGLLDKVGSFVNNPMVRGLGGAAALGFNPLMGLLAVPALSKKKQQTDAQQQLTKLLSSTSNVQGPSAIARSELDGSALGTIPGKRAQLPTASTPQGQAKAMGLLSQANPQAFSQAMVQGLFSQQQERAAPADLRIMDALNIPKTEEGYARFKKMQAESKSQDPTDALLATLLADQRRQQLAAEREAQQLASKERETTFNTRQVNLNSSLSGIEELAQYNDALEETFLRPGAFVGARETALQGYEAFKSAIGGDTEKERETLTNLDLFEKGAANLLLDLLPQLEGINARTDNRLEQIKKSIADIGTQPDANRKIMADIIDNLLSISEVEGFKVRNRDKYIELAKKLRTGTGSKRARNVTMPDGSVIKNVPPNLSDDEVLRLYQRGQ